MVRHSHPRGPARGPRGIHDDVDDAQCMDVDEY